MARSFLLCAALCAVPLAAAALPRVPELNTISTHSLVPYACGNYSTSALFFSSYSQSINDPELLYDGMCDGGNSTYFEGATAGDDFALFKDLGEVELGGVTAMQVYQTDEGWTTSMPLVLNHTIAVSRTSGTSRSVFLLNVFKQEDHGRITLQVAVKLYTLRPSSCGLSAPGFTWNATNTPAGGNLPVPGEATPPLHSVFKQTFMHQYSCNQAGNLTYQGSAVFFSDAERKADDPALLLNGPGGTYPACSAGPLYVQGAVSGTDFAAYCDLGPSVTVDSVTAQNLTSCKTWALSLDVVVGHTVVGVKSGDSVRHWSVFQFTQVNPTTSAADAMVSVLDWEGFSGHGAPTSTACALEAPGFSWTKGSKPSL